MNGFKGAVALLTRVPVGIAIQSESQLAGSVPWFSVVGGLLGLLIGGIYAAGLVIVNPWVAATIAVGAGVAVTGALHEDGLADVADAFWGGWRREDRLRILEDPRLGAFGALAIVFSLSLRIGVVSSLTAWQGIALLPAAHSLSRSITVSTLKKYDLISEGLGTSYVRSLTSGQARLGIFAALGLALAAIGVWAVVGAVLVWIGSWVVGSIALKKIEGITGDVLGAAQQVGESLLLLMGAAVAGSSWPLAWWL